MMSRTGPPCDRYFGPFGSWHRLAILESRLAVDAGPLRLGGEVGAHHLRALDVGVERRSSSASRLALRPKPIARRAGLEGPRPRGTVVVSGGTAGRPYPRRMAAAVGRPVARRRRG